MKAQQPRWFPGIVLGAVVAGAVMAVLLRGAHSASALGARGTESVATARPLAALSPPLEKTVMAEDVPLTRGEFSLGADGKRSYFAVGSAYYAFDERGDLTKRISISYAFARKLIPLSNGNFISVQNHASGQLSLLGPDGTLLRTVVKRGPSPENLRQDRTTWASPSGAAFDAIHQLLFVLDTTTAPAGTADPDWSRIAVFDAQGKYLREIAAYDAQKSPPTDERRTWYDDIEVDAKHSVVYVTARASQELRAFDYSGAPRGRAPGVAGIAVLPNGNVAVGDPDHRHVRIYDANLHLVRSLEAAGISDLESDAAGRLYASVADPTILYLRWSADLSTSTAIRPIFRTISVGAPSDSAIAGAPFTLPVSVRGRPTPTEQEWQVFARPSDGSDLTWRKLDTTYARGSIEVRPPPDLLGFNQIAVRYGGGAISATDGVRDLHVEKTVRFERGPQGASVTLRSLAERSAFRRGEAIALHIDARGAAAGDPRTLTLQHDGKDLLTANLSPADDYLELPARLTRRLMPGHYTLSVKLAAGPADTYELDLAEAEPSSPLQRILYHEFGQNLPPLPATITDKSEQLAFVRDYVDSVANLGFSRETDRSGLQAINSQVAGVWRTGSVGEQPDHATMPEGGAWGTELYLDRATARGVSFDTQMLVHCSGVRLADSWFPPLNRALQRLSQWLGKYPAFYGFNYNDEAFFARASPDKEWIDAAAIGHSLPDAYRAGLAHMYGELDRAVLEVRPDLARTATPMWQFPAVEGSYAPTIYEHMTESYSHYLSEGFSWPFCPAHSAEFLRRPRMPLMAVFDNGYQAGNGESYLKDAMQVLGRGAQGFGVEHTVPLRDGPAANALRAMNAIGEAYGPIFSEAEPSNEAAVLYSYAQDTTERRDVLGTPHWERVLALYGAGLMAGLPMSIAYEEDVASGSLLQGGKPKAKLLFLVGQTAEVPDKVKSALGAFRAAGGTVVIDADSRDLKGAQRFPVSLLTPAHAAHGAVDVDSLFPDTQPAYATIAGALNEQFGRSRRFPVDTDDPWVAKSHFDGGAIKYVLIASETSPYPWSAPSVWALGARYSKSSWPKTVEVHVPRAPVIYDAFERQVVPAGGVDKTATIRADLRTFPGKLYALAPRALGAPKLSARIDHDEVTYAVNVGLPARVPLRITLRGADGSTSTLFRGTDLSGALVHTIARPSGIGPWRLEVSELLGGASSSLDLPQSDISEPWVTRLPAVEMEREPQIRALVGEPKRVVRLIGAFDALPRELGASLLQALKAKGLRVTLDAAPATPATETLLALSTIAGKGPGQLIQGASSAGLFGRTLDEHYPGIGRGFVSAAFAPRAYGENCIAIVAGDQRGLELATKRFIAFLGEAAPPAHVAAATPTSKTQSIVGTPTASVDMPKLSERVGVRLAGIRAWHGKLAVAANGYLANLARVDDDGDQPRIVATTRAGESPATTSLFLSNDGKSFGLAARTTQRFGEAFFLTGPSSATPDAFTSFGDEGQIQHAFAASGDASTILAPGPYGVVAWRRAAGGWREAWAVDYWKKFDSLDWSLTAGEARIPSFDTIVPRNGDLGLIAFVEFSAIPYQLSQQQSRTEVSARSLTDGAVRWSFSTPAIGAQVFPKIYADDDGALVVLQAQVGAAGPFHYYVLRQGHLAGTWNSDAKPLAFALSTKTQRIATAYGDSSRLLEVRSPDGTVAFSKTWHSQPLAIAFAEDGASVFVSDDEGTLSRVDAQGKLVWQTRLGCSAELAEDDGRLYAAGWDGRLRAFTADGKERWKFDLTGPMAAQIVDPRSVTRSNVHEPVRASSASSVVPKGINLLRTGQATLSVGGTPGWKSAGKIGIQASSLTNGTLDDVVADWVPFDEVFLDGTAFRKVWAEVSFKQPTSLHSLTVYESPSFPDSWPTESLIQVWDEAEKRWKTATHGVFLRGPVATYTLNLQRVTRLRYVPWSNYFRNFHTSEIEVR